MPNTRAGPSPGDADRGGLLPEREEFRFRSLTRMRALLKSSPSVRCRDARWTRTRGRARPRSTRDRYTPCIVGKLARRAARRETGRQRHEEDRHATHGVCPQESEVPSVGRHDWAQVVPSRGGSVTRRCSGPSTGDQPDASRAVGGCRATEGKPSAIRRPREIADLPDGPGNRHRKNRRNSLFGASKRWDHHQVRSCCSAM